MEAASEIGWREYDGSRAYIRCLQDKVIPLSMQDALISRTGVSWIVKDIDSSHSPFMSMPDELSTLVEGIIAEFYAA